jgi:hypothetical protein
MAQRRTIHGVLVGADGTGASGPDEALLSRVAGGLDLIAIHDPSSLHRLQRHLRRILVELDLYAAMHYMSQFDACIVNADFVMRADTTTTDIASCLIHEATHARLDHAGVEYTENIRGRIERICCNAELRFLRRVPNAKDAIDRVERATRRTAVEGEWSNQRLREQYHQSRIQALRRVGCPEWIIRFVQRLARSGAA